MATHPRGDSAAQPVPLGILFSSIIFKAKNHFTDGWQDDANMIDVRELCVDLLHSAAEVAIYTNVLDWALEFEEERLRVCGRSDSVEFLSRAIAIAEVTMCDSKNALRGFLGGAVQP